MRTEGLADMLKLIIAFLNFPERT